MPEINECSRCGKEINTYEWFNNRIERYLFSSIEHDSDEYKYELAQEYCRFAFCNTCYPIARKELD